VNVENTIKELVQLRRGHGLHGQDVFERIGPDLRRASGIGPSDARGEARQKLIGFLAEAVEALPSDLRISVQAALALAPASEERFLKDRMVWLGIQLDRDPRTAARRVEAGFVLLAEQICNRPAGQPVPRATEYAPEGWHVERLSSILLLHNDPVQLMETRRIISDVEDLDCLSVSWSVPRTEDVPDSARIRVQTIYGGELREDPELSTQTYWSGRLALPHRLAKGEAHDYQVQVTSVARSLLVPYYVLSPYRRVDGFELRARFPLDDLPKRVWKLDGIPYRLVDERLNRTPEVRLDTLGEVVVSFTRLRQGLSYGLQWEPSP
jgi:hypothetical protein